MKAFFLYLYSLLFAGGHSFLLPPVSSINGVQLTQRSKIESGDEEVREEYIEISYEDYFDGTKPDSSWNLALTNFVRQGKTILPEIAELLGLKKPDPLKPPACLGLILSNEAVKETEDRRIAAGEGVDAHPVSLALYDVGCSLLDNLFDERPIQRFWFLETIARIPYFSYVRCVQNKAAAYFEDQLDH